MFGSETCWSVGLRKNKKKPSHEPSLAALREPAAIMTIRVCALSSDAWLLSPEHTAHVTKTVNFDFLEIATCGQWLPYWSVKYRQSPRSLYVPGVEAESWKAIKY